MQYEEGDSATYPQQYPYSHMGSEHNTEGSIRFQLMFDDVIDDIEHTLKCEEPVMDKTGQVSWKQIKGSGSLINEIGMGRIRTILRANLNKNAPLSKLDDREICEICKEVEKNVANTLFDNFAEFEIPDIDAATTIRETIGNTVFFNIKKSIDGAFLKHLRSTHYSTEMVTQNPQKQNSGQDSNAGILRKLFKR